MLGGEGASGAARTTHCPGLPFPVLPKEKLLGGAPGGSPSKLHFPGPLLEEASVVAPEAEAVVGVGGDSRAPAVDEPTGLGDDDLGSAVLATGGGDELCVGLHAASTTTKMALPVFLFFPFDR